MRKELDRKLVEDFPILYQWRYWDMRDAAMCWGFPGDGWEPLIRELSEHLEAYNRRHPKSPIVAIQVKEKFGSLRFYHVLLHEKYSPLMRLRSRVSSFITYKLRAGRVYWPLRWKVRDIRERIWRTELEQVEEFISEAENKSHTICERCGDPGKLRETGWVLTLCDNCYNEWKRERS